MSQTRYYSAQNATREIGGVFFSITSLAAGTAWGVTSTDDPERIKVLDALVANPKSAVTAITEAEFNQQMEAKKKASFLADSPILRTPLAPQPQTSLKETAKPAVVVEGEERPEEEKPVEIKTTLDSVDDAVQTTQVVPSPTAASESEPQPKKKTKKG